MASKGIASYSCTSWRSGLRFLQDAHAIVMVVMLQEHHLLAADVIVGAVAAAGRAGWHLLIEPAVPSQGTATSTRYNTGGVAVAVRQHITARRLKAADALKGRAIVIEAIGAGLPPARITIASVYLEVGLADHEVNRNILAAVAEAVAPMVGPFIIGGDYQMPPQQLEDTGFAQLLNGKVLAPPCGHATLRRPDGKATIIDMFVVSRGLAAATCDVQVMAEREATPHWPVCLQHKTGLVWIPTLAASRAGTVDKVIGPPPPPNSAALGGALRTLRKVRAKAEGHESVEEYSSIALDRASGDVLRNAHAEAMRMSMQPGRPHALPRIQWRRADQLDPKAGNPTSKGADWLYMRLRRLVGIASVLPQRRATGSEMAEAMSTRSNMLSPPPWVALAWQCDKRGPVSDHAGGCRARANHMSAAPPGSDVPDRGVRGLEARTARRTGSGATTPMDRVGARGNDGRR